MSNRRMSNVQCRRKTKTSTVEIPCSIFDVQNISTIKANDYRYILFDSPAHNRSHQIWLITCRMRRLKSAATILKIKDVAADFSAAPGRRAPPAWPQRRAPSAGKASLCSDYSWYGFDVHLSSMIKNIIRYAVCHEAGVTFRHVTFALALLTKRRPFR